MSKVFKFWIRNEIGSDSQFVILETVSGSAQMLLIVLHGFLMFNSDLVRALHVNNEKAKMLLKPDAMVVTERHHIWPSLTDDQWMQGKPLFHIFLDAV